MMIKIPLYRRFRRFVRRHLVDAHPAWFSWVPRLTGWLHRRHVPLLTKLAYIIEKLLIPAQLYATVPFDGGMRLRLRLGDMIQAQIFYSGEWEPALARRVCGCIRPDSLYLDLGAHCGDLALLASRAQLGVEVYAFEPDPNTVADMRCNLELNQADNVHVVPAAVADRTGKLPLYTDDESFGCVNHTLARTEGFWYGTPIEVDVVTVDETCADAGKPVSVIKLDIEGAELLALRGAETILRRDRPALFVEAYAPWTAAFGYTPAELRAYLEGLGYRCARIDEVDGNLRPIGTHETDGLSNWMALHVEKGGDRILEGEETSNSG